MESSGRPADMKNMDSPTVLILSFILAIVVGYFAGRIVGLLGENDRRFDFWD
jgi:hypothetical protein